MFELAVNWSDVMTRSLEGGRLLGPECILVVFACLALLVDLGVPREKSGGTIAWVALAGVILSGILVWLGFSGMIQGTASPRSVFWGAAAVDPFAAFFKLVILFGTLFSIVLVHESKELRGRSMGEFYALLLSAVAGMCLMVGATDMVMAFLAIELVSVPSFALVAYVRRDRHGTEAALKYVLYAAFSTGLMLFGLSILFGLTGSTSFARVNDVLAGTGTLGTITIAVACLLSFAGFAYKMGAAPFHFWAPDVYQGAPTAVTAWLSVTSKAAGVGLFTRFVLSFLRFPGEPGSLEHAPGSLAFGGFDWVTAIMVISAVTMTIGNFGALFQTSMKRLLAYSSVAHVGYILMGLAAVQAAPTGSPLNPVSLVLSGPAAPGGGWEASGGAAVAFYMAAYLFMNLGAFGVVLAVSNVTGTDDLSSFRALGRRAPALALALAIFVFALIGLPPTAGFTGKLQLFMAAIQQAPLRHSFWLLVAVAGVNTAVSVYYYLRVVKTMYLDGILDPEAREPLAGSPGLTVVCLFLIFPVLGFGLAFNRIVELTMGLELLRG